MKILVTGGAGFIGSAVVRHAVRAGHSVVNLDALTYAANLENVRPVANSPLSRFEHADIRDRAALDRIFAAQLPDAVLHLAAESHVDRSIDGPADFVETNITGTFNLLEAARAFWVRQGRPAAFRFHHVSTDEVYGTLGPEGQFTEDTPYAPNSPYAASKAAIRNHSKSVALYAAQAGWQVRCNSVHPAAVLTPMWEPMLGDGPDREANMAALVADTPLKRFGTPEEVAALCIFLASDESAYMTGAELTLDGGLLAGSAASPG